jgi:predicted nucleic-acid-binding protein
MIGIDTNVLIRYIVRDDLKQTQIATKFLEKRLTQRESGFVSQIVLCEIVWVLKKAYGFEKDVIIQVIQQILDTAELTVEHAESARRAVSDYEKGDADFSDYWIGLSNQFHGCDYTVTFDLRAASHPAFCLCR